MFSPPKAGRLGWALCLLILFASSALAGEDWFHVQTGHFTVIGDCSAKRLVRISDQFEQFHQALSTLFPQASLIPPLPITIVALNGSSALRPFAPTYKGKPTGAGGYFDIGVDSYYVVLDAQLTTVTPIVFHELEHAVIHENLGRMPAWLSEGMAEFMSTLKTVEGGRKIVIGTVIDYHLRQLNRRAHIPLRTLMQVDYSSPYLNESDQAHRFYAQSWAFVHYLLLGNERKRAPQLAAFIGQINSNRPLETRLREAFGVGFKVLEDEFEEYLTQFSFPTSVYSLPEKVQAPASKIPTRLTETQWERYQGDLLWNLRRGKAAEKHYEAALRGGDETAEAHAALGALCLSQSRLIEAETHTGRAVELAPALFRAQLIRGTVLDELGKSKEAIQHLQRAVHLRPGVARAYALLSVAQQGRGQKEAASASLQQAMQLDPSAEEWLWDIVCRELRMHRSESVVAHAEHFIRSRGWQSRFSPYFALASGMASLQSGRSNEAENVFRQALNELNSKAWPYLLFEYLDRRLSERELLKRTKDNRELTEARTYLGLYFLFTGRQHRAIPHLKWVRERGADDVAEFEFAMAELARAEGKR